MDFDAEQAPRVKAALEQWFAWQRRTQLADYAELLAVAAGVRQPGRLDTLDAILQAPDRAAGLQTLHVVAGIPQFGQHHGTLQGVVVTAPPFVYYQYHRQFSFSFGVVGHIAFAGNIVGGFIGHRFPHNF